MLAGTAGFFVIHYTPAEEALSIFLQSKDFTFFGLSETMYNNTIFVSATAGTAITLLIIVLWILTVICFKMFRSEKTGQEAPPKKTAKNERESLYLDNSHELFCLYFGKLMRIHGETEFHASD